MTISNRTQYQALNCIFGVLLFFFVTNWIILGAGATITDNTENINKHIHDLNVSSNYHDTIQHISSPVDGERNIPDKLNTILAKLDIDQQANKVSKNIYNSQVGSQENGENPDAEFEFTPSDPGPDEEITFDASGSEAPAGEIAEYEWYIPSSEWSGTTYSSGETLSGDFDEHGEYEVELTVTDNGEKTDTVTETIVVDEEAPTARFDSTPSAPGPDEEITFDASGSEAPAGEIAEYEWYIPSSEWSGTTYSSGAIITGDFDEYGEYEVELEITDNGEKTDTVTETIIVDEEGPTARFEFTPSDPGPDEEITFDASGSEAPAGEIAEYEWYIPSSEWSGTTYSSGETLSGDFDEHGEYEVELEITDNGEKTDTVTKTIVVDEEAPTARFDSTPSAPGPDEEITFDGSGSEAPAGEIAEYEWYIPSSEWSGTTYSSRESISGEFSERGEYEIELTVTDNGGKDDQRTQTIVVGDVPSFSIESIGAENTRIVTGEFVEITATVTNDGDAAGETVLSLSQDGEEVRSADTSLQVGETDTISFDVTVPTTPSEVTYQVDTGDDTGTVTVTAVSEDELDDAEYQVDIADLSSPTAGDDLRVVVEIENVGELPGEQLIEVAADGLGVTSKSISLGGGERTQEEFTIETENSGTYDVEVSGNSDTAEADATVLAPSEIVISEFNIADIEQDPVVSATLSNLGDVEGEQTVELTVDGETIESKRISVQPGEESTVEFDPDIKDLPEGEAEFGLSTDDDSETERATVVSPSEIVISEFSVTDVEQGPTAVATLSNRGDVTDDQTVELTADGDVVAQERVDVQPDKETVVEFTPDAADLPEGDVEFGVATGDDSATEVASLPESNSDTSESTSSSADGETTTAAESDSNTPASSGNDGGIVETIPGGNVTLISVFLLLSLLSVGGYLTSAGSDSSTETDHSGTAASTEKNASNQATVATPDDDSATSDSRISDLPEDFSVEYDDIERGDVIGSGGFADVYTGRLDIGQTEITVAVKEPRMSGTIELSQNNQLLEEAKRWSRLDDHEHIVRVIDYGGRPLPWIVMEYMEAGSLDMVADEMSFEEKLQAAVEVTDAVNHAHQKGVAHLDIKPENILFTESGTGRPVAKVADWGLSKHLLDQSKSREGMTVEYAAPEQFDPEQSSDNFTDIYQLGAVFYELFTGRPPFSGEVFAVMEQIKNEDPDPPSNIADVPKELDEILLTAMSKDPDNRYESVLYLRDNLQKITHDT